MVNKDFVLWQKYASLHMHAYPHKTCACAHTNRLECLVPSHILGNLFVSTSLVLCNIYLRAEAVKVDWLSV